MSEISIDWLTDNHDCETCGSSWAEGARVRIDGQVALELIPLAHCYDGSSWDEREVFAALLAHLGHSLSDDAETETDPMFCRSCEGAAPQQTDVSGAVSGAQSGAENASR